MKRLEDLLQSARQAGVAPSAVPTGVSSTDADAATLCPHCGGAGFLRRDVPLGHPDFGRAIPCSCVLEENAVERDQRLRRYSNIGALTRYTFENLSVRGPLGTAAQGNRYQTVVEAARRYAEDPRGWFVLLGASASGKTHLAAATANYVIASGRPVLFVVVPDLLDHLRTAFAPESDVSYDHLFDQVRNAALLVLDDLGAQSATAWADEKLYQIINHRFNLSLATIFTTSRPIEELEDRIRSRLVDSSLSQVHTLPLGVTASPDPDDPLALPLLREMTFATFKYQPTGPQLPDSAARKLQQAYTIARNFANRPEGWLVLAGETGSGKTHLAAAVAHQQRESGRPYTFLAVPDLLDRLRSAAQGSRGREGPDYIDRVRTAPFLVLDDLGVHSDTAWAQEKLFQILNYRYNAKLPTVLTVRPSDELPAALRSRLYDDKVSLFHEIDAPDYRNPERPRNAPPRRGRQQR